MVHRSIQKLRQLVHRDTVASVGLVIGRSLPFVDSNSAIRVFRQGLSLDEVCEVGHILGAASMQSLTP